MGDDDGGGERVVVKICGECDWGKDELSRLMVTFAIFSTLFRKPYTLSVSPYTCPCPSK